MIYTLKGIFSSFLLPYLELVTIQTKTAEPSHAHRSGLTQGYKNPQRQNEKASDQQTTHGFLLNLDALLFILQKDKFQCCVRTASALASLTSRSLCVVWL